MPHVTAEVRTVYRSARGVKLTKHAAYIAAAKKLIADRCAAWDEARENAWAERNAAALAPCRKEGPYTCRIHTFTKYEQIGPEDFTEGGMLYYRRLLPRLVRFLKYVDGRRDA